MKLFRFKALSISLFIYFSSLFPPTLILSFPPRVHLIFSWQQGFPLFN